MKNINLECVPSWRYCNVRAGEKIPFPAGWQSTPIELKHITGPNIGLLLGEHSGGVVALDFDGASAWDFFDQRIGGPVPETISWTSGKPARCQMAFWVDSEYWPYLHTQKITATQDSIIQPGEGFEFRWNGCQSVVPPSRLTDGRQYEWVIPPAAAQDIRLPDAVLAYWLTISNPEPEVIETVDRLPITEQEVIELAAELKSLYPKLDYDTWIRVTWAFCNTVGTEDGITLMKYHYPENTAGEYKRLQSQRPAGRICTMGTVKKLIRDRQTVYTGVSAVRELRRDQWRLQQQIKTG